MQVNKRAAIAAFLTLSCLLPQLAQALILNGPAACQSIGGVYATVTTPPRTGNCVLSRNFTITQGTTLDLVSAVSLEIKANATVRVNGRLALARHARMLISPGSVINRGVIHLEDDAVLHLWSGLIENFSVIHSEGFLKNKWSPEPGRGILNHGRIDNVDGGLIANAGLFVNDSDSMLVNGLKSEIINYSKATYVARNEIHAGKITNWRGSEWRLDGGIVNIDGGGTIENYGTMRLSGFSSQVILNVNATLQNQPGALFQVFTGATLNIQGLGYNESATVENRGGGTINIAKNAALTSNRGQVFNDVQSTVVNNGRLVFNCARWNNDGVLVGFFFSYCNYKPILKLNALSFP